MQFADLRALLHLPMEEIEIDGGCNLTATTLIFNVIAGASALFYDASVEAIADRGDRSRRFRDVVADYYPWEPHDALRGREAAQLLYDFTRNPLTHTLGVAKNPHAFPGVPDAPGPAQGVLVAKGPLPPAAVRELAHGPDRPPWLIDPTIGIERGTYVLHVIALAWGLHELLRRLFRDRAQVERAEATARRLLNG